MSVEQRVSTTEMAPPTEALTVAPTPDAPGTDLVPAETPKKAKKAAKAPKEAEPVKVSRRRPKSPGRTTRVVLRKMDAWSVLKLSLVYYTSLFVVILVAGVLLWSGATSVGVIENVESFMVDIGFDDFRLIPGDILRGLALGGLVLVVAGTVANVIMCALFNLMGDITGGLKLTLQEDVARPPRPKRIKKLTAGDEGDATV